MNTSFYNGIAGIKTHQFGIDTWADNIANQNMYGFKANLPEFSTQFSQVLNSAQNSPLTDDMGLGIKIQGTSLDLAQGELIDSNSGFDTAIEGHGWYAFKDGNQNYFTKLGSFHRDVNGDIVNANGEYLLGTVNTSLKPINLSQSKLESFGQAYTSNGLQNPKIFTVDSKQDTPLGAVNNQTKINLPGFLYIPATPTKNVTFGANLNADVESQINSTTNKEIAKTSDHFTTGLTNQDGSKSILDMTFTKQFPQQNVGSLWNSEFKILKDVGQKQSGISYDPTQYLSYPNSDILYQILDDQIGTLTFNGTGALTNADIPSLSNDGIPIALSLGTPLDSTVSNSGYDGMTAVKGLGSETKSLSNDGKDEGILEKYEIEPDGNIRANFSNGDSSSVGKIALFHFQNEGGLQKINGNMFTASQNSGKAFFYTKDGVNINGDSILTNKLENSNVQTSVAMSELIVMQKAFDASAKSITTSDQMIQNAINMKK